jgi:hypothetical protein
MTQYVTSPFKPPVQLGVAGTPSYLIGSYNDKTGPTQGYVISDASNGTTTATLVFQITSGNIPVAGSLITVIGTANGSGNFNVTNVAIASVVSTTLQGVCTVTYTISSTASPTTQTQDYGQVIIPQPEVGETVSGAYKSVPVARPFNNPNIQEGQSLTATLNLGAGLSAVVASLQGADIDLDSEYTDIHVYPTSGLQSWQSGSDASFITSSASPGAQGTTPGQANLLNYRFYRFKITSVTGSGTVIGKIEF